MTKRYRVVTEASVFGDKTADIVFYTPEEIDKFISDFKQRIDVVSRSIDVRIDSLNSRIDTNAAGLKRDLASLVQKTNEIPKLSERINGICNNDIPKLNDTLRSYVKSEMLNLPHECKELLAPFMKSQIDPYFKTFSIETKRLLEQKREFEEQSRKILDEMAAKMQEFENPLQTLAAIKVQKQDFEKQKQEFEQQQQKVFEDIKSLKTKNRILSAAVIVLAVIVCAKLFF
jgi:chromosome segregation ATPase